ncbi:SpoIIE family protein phosphatase [Williamwhitmania taraxaci]|uniref:Tetratricopeptide repeat-containing protein n=1 Tax=Williamwhitmania taraxaci TaxID=1640674 RepID=A0A1G6K5H6_9BACT|nr:SpoIIE family protein phosphatase [Williamwhitmania taraxaci]SDC26322.1 Tetratricopeptide repeat-containing protein [Williamwhitmania taraxaci]
MVKRISLIAWFIILNLVCLFDANLNAQELRSLSKPLQNKVEEYLELANRYTAAGNNQQAVMYLSKVAFLYWENGLLREAAELFLKSVPQNEKVGNYNDIKAIYSNVGLIYSDLDKIDLAQDAFEKSLVVRKKLGNRTEISSGMIDVGYIYIVQKRHEQSIKILEEALSIATDLDDARLISNACRLLGIAYDARGMVAKARDYEAKYLTYKRLFESKTVKEEYEAKVGKTMAETERERIEKRAKQLELDLQKLTAAAAQDSLGSVVKATEDSLRNAERLSRQRQLEIGLLNKEKAIKELALKEKEAVQKNQQLIIYSILGGMLLLIILAVVMLYGYRSKQRANNRLESQNREIGAQRDHIRKQNENITKSINYAQGIQKALLPSQDTLVGFLEDSFIFFRPRDLVSGDYYWFAPILSGDDYYEPGRGKFAIAAIDCTGHGVPGAFLSMIGYNLLNEIIRAGIHTPSLILQRLNQDIRRVLRQDETDNRDGMDMTLCVIDFDKNVLEYAGAKNPLLYIKNGEMIRIKGDKEPVGGFHTEQLRTFTNHTIDIDGPTYFYLFSDGYADQFGGPAGIKIMLKSFQDMLFENHQKSMEDQKAILRNHLINWIGSDFKQVDDVLVMGFKLG